MTDDIFSYCPDCCVVVSEYECPHWVYEHDISEDDYGSS